MKMMANGDGARRYFSDLRAKHIVRKTVPLYLLILPAIIYPFLFHLDMITTYMFYILLCFVFIFIREYYSSIVIVPNTVYMVTKGQDSFNIFEKPSETLIKLYHQDNKVELEEAPSTVNIDEILHQLGGNIGGPYYGCIIIDHYMIEETKYYSSDTTQIYACNNRNSNQTVLLVGTGDKSEEHQRAIIDLIMKKEHMDEYDHLYTIGVGYFVDRKEELHTSYMQALKAMNSKEKKESRGVYYADMMDNDQYSYDICSKLIDNFCKTIHDGAFNRIELESQNFRSVLMRNSSDALCNLLCLEFTFKVGAVSKAKKVSIDRQFLNSYRLRLFQSGLTKQECDRYLYDLITPLSKNLTESQIKSSKDVIKRESLTMEHLLIFIQENISNPELSVNYIAEHFHVSQSNLSHFYRKHKRISISEYIKSLKIELIKKMLVESSLSVNQIAEKTGYYRPSSFIRMFKASTDMTPAEYRNSYFKQ